MKLQVTGIVIDWQEDFDWIDPISTEERIQIKAEIIGTVWDASNKGDLIGKVSESYGWSIESIDYRTVK